MTTPRLPCAHDMRDPFEPQTAAGRELDLRSRCRACGAVLRTPPNVGPTPTTLVDADVASCLATPVRRVYYVHCLAIYDTPQEQRDVDLLVALGFAVVNPNEPAHRAAADELRSDGRDAMSYFLELVKASDVVAFRALPDGRIPIGVAKEIELARQLGRPIIELPSGISSRTMTLDATREYLREVGQR